MADPPSPTKRSLHAAGSNSHSQLSPTPGDIEAFTAFPASDSASDQSHGAVSLDILHTTWSTTTLIHSSHIHSLGFQSFATELAGSVKLHSAIGDHNGLIGCLDQGGSVYLLTADKNDPSVRTAPLVSAADDGPRVGQLALAGNGRVAVSFKQASGSQLAHVVEFAGVEAFKAWYADPSAPDCAPEAHHMLPGRVKQLLANTATFLLLMDGGGVYTWGDGRYQTLARTTLGEGAVEAGKPGVVEALGGLRISKVQSGGWLGAALSEDGALYIWGATLPGKEGAIRCLDDASSGEVALVDIQVDGEIVDVVDFGVGDNHVAAVTPDGRLFVVGDNGNGQCGLGSDQAFFEDWTQVPGLEKVQRVLCGPKATFAWTS